MGQAGVSPVGDPSKIDADVAIAVEAQSKMMGFQGPHRRGQHPKPHGCVMATFEVLGDIPDHYRVGLFAKPATYAAFIRFSNGSQKDDSVPDIHGMAIKLVGIQPADAPDNRKEPLTQDFILADQPVFFMRNADDAARFMQDFAADATAMVQDVMKGKPPRKIKAHNYRAWLEKTRPEEVPTFDRFFAGKELADPLETAYWSQVPFAFGADGKAACRFAARAVNARQGDAQGSDASPPGPEKMNRLRQAMIERLVNHQMPATFDFTVQVVQVPEDDPSVIETPTVEWNVPEQRVAVIKIPPQKFNVTAVDRFGEDLVYTPWHALQEHRPLGEINLVRKAVYLASSTMRQRQSGSHPPKPEELGAWESYLSR
jgi:hypothetical protein